MNLLLNMLWQPLCKWICFNKYKFYLKTELCVINMFKITYIEVFFFFFSWVMIIIFKKSFGSVFNCNLVMQKGSLLYRP